MLEVALADPGPVVAEPFAVFEQLEGLLQESHIERRENTVRWQWRVGDLALEDNRAGQHYGVDESDDHTRTLRRVTIDGDVRAGVDGRRSALLTPESVPGPACGIASGPPPTARSPRPDPLIGPPARARTGDRRSRPTSCACLRVRCCGQAAWACPEEAENCSVSAMQDLSGKFLTNLVDIC